jgi:hypothetical protein
MARKKSHYRARIRTFCQDSPFLDLPGEIRTLIYRAALLRPTPIDLWPAAEIKNPRERPDLQQRIAKHQKSAWRPDARFRRQPERDARFRDQRDLQFVRKEMATGLLATCKQINQEASHVFWTENIFRFSGDENWNGIRRFLLAIGPRARSMLSVLEVHPMNYFPVRVTDEDDDEEEAGNWPFNHSGDWTLSPGEMKNHPKMHMPKIPYSWETSKNASQVLQLLRTEATLKELRLIWTSCTNDLYYIPPIPSAEENFYNRIRARLPFKVAVEIHPGASFRGGILPEGLTENDIRLTFHPGSYISDLHPDDNPGAGLFAELTTYDPRPRDIDPYAGVAHLYRMDPISVHARGGKSSSVRTQPKTSRHLKGFGGCRFIYLTRYCCPFCAADRAEGVDGTLASTCHVCAQRGYPLERTAITVKGRYRAIRLGVFDNVNVMMDEGI